MALDAALLEEPYCYLTTTGRVTGNPHEIEIWFGHALRRRRDTLYLLSGGGERSDWVRNLRREPSVRVRIGDRTFAGSARVLRAGTAEAGTARRLLFEKYQPGYDPDLTSWRESSLPVAIDLEP
ncbi:MAG: nitroreductase family deazaflavin-dependent oxidoreductase [Chloroflexi bacterium]|nr:nitroreductase family deazaflavin-dependent oxidoreductase [Chloroflexota bacterium]